MMVAGGKPIELERQLEVERAKVAKLREALRLIGDLLQRPKNQHSHRENAIQCAAAALEETAS